MLGLPFGTPLVTETGTHPYRALHRPQGRDVQGLQDICACTNSAPGCCLRAADPSSNPMMGRSRRKAPTRRSCPDKRRLSSQYFRMHHCIGIPPKKSIMSKSEFVVLQGGQIQSAGLPPSASQGRDPHPGIRPLPRGYRRRCGTARRSQKRPNSHRPGHKKAASTRRLFRFRSARRRRASGE